jgi:hypothetical protein
MILCQAFIDHFASTSVQVWVLGTLGTNGVSGVVSGLLVACSQAYFEGDLESVQVPFQRIVRRRPCQVGSRLGAAR